MFMAHFCIDNDLHVVSLFLKQDNQLHVQIDQVDMGWLSLWYTYYMYFDSPYTDAQQSVQTKWPWNDTLSKLYSYVADANGAVQIPTGP